MHLRVLRSPAVNFRRRWNGHINTNRLAPLFHTAIGGGCYFRGISFRGYRHFISYVLYFYPFRNRFSRLRARFRCRFYFWYNFFGIFKIFFSFSSFFFNNDFIFCVLYFFRTWNRFQENLACSNWRSELLIFGIIK